MQFGTTISHRELDYLGLQADKAATLVKDLDLSWVRLCSYWSEIEEREGVFDFERLDKMFDLMKGRKIVLTVGLKAPRWPEHYLPKWVLEEIKPGKVHVFKPNGVWIQYLERNLRKLVTRYENRVDVWQIENEPFEPYEPHGERIWPLDKSLIEHEVAIVGNLSKKPMMVTIWGNELVLRKTNLSAMEVADIVGWDLYPKHPYPGSQLLKWIKPYMGPLSSDAVLQAKAREIDASGKRFWVGELQAEPWETENPSQEMNPGSCNPEQLMKNVAWVKQFDPEVVLLWGFEYWLWRREKFGDERWIEAVREAISR